MSYLVLWKTLKKPFYKLQGKEGSKMTLDDKISQENSQIDKLRHRLKGQMNQDLYEDDNLFLRFLRARSHNIDAAETMIKNHLNWRNQYKVDTILKDYTPHEFMASEYITFSRLGTDLENAPLTYSHFGQLDTRGILKAVSKHDITMYSIHYLETDMEDMKQRSNKTGQLLDKCVYILNCENFSVGTATHKQTLETLGILVTMYEGNYPERLKKLFAINVSYYFMIFWAVIKQFLSANTVDKIKIYGKTGWQEELLKHVSPDVLPAFLGGTLTDTDGDPMCRSIIRYGGQVPESLFMRTIESRLPGGKKLHVHRMSKAEVTFQVLYPGSLLEWEFVVNRDIVFSVSYKESTDSDPRQVMPQQKIEASALSESGMYQCEEKGIYIIEFDNSYSWMRNKEIYYTASVVTPHDSNPKHKIA